MEVVVDNIATSERITEQAVMSVMMLVHLQYV